MKSKKRLFIILGAVGLLIVAGLLLYFFVFAKQGNSDSTDGADSPFKPSQSQSAIREEVSSSLRTDDSATVNQKLDQKLTQNVSKEDKSYLYTVKGSLALSSGTPNYDAALDSYYKAEEVAPTYETALNIADTAFRKGDKTAAIQYYKLYLSRSVDKDGKDLDPQGRTNYEKRLKELES